MRLAFGDQRKLIANRQPLYAKPHKHVQIKPKNSITQPVAQ